MTASITDGGYAKALKRRTLEGGKIFFASQGRDSASPVTPLVEPSSHVPDATDSTRRSGIAERAGNDRPLRKTSRLSWADCPRNEPEHAGVPGPAPPDPHDPRSRGRKRDRPH